MTGLRARQKRLRHERILDAALLLFRNAGYDAVRTEDIAAAADVSVGTLYNYFENKGDLLLALVTLEVAEVLEQGAAVVANPPPDIAQALDQLVGGYYDHSNTYLTKELWRTAMALTIQAAETPFSARYTALDQSLTDQVCALVAQLQHRGLARKDIDARALGQVIFNNLNQMFIEFVKVENTRIEALKLGVARQNAVLAQLLALPAQ
ncbi:MAG: TetR/AcrR family transcriptional regulator [Pseudorhodobacter sp.]|nr:TetR/AcrR family transcriptional regulator [Pseudorhodobacter sp.]